MRHALILRSFATRSTLFGTLAASVLAGSALAQSTIIDFESNDDGVLLNGQLVSNSFFGGGKVFLRTFGLTQIGAVAFDSDPSGPNQDNADFLTDMGNILIMQNPGTDPSVDPDPAENGGLIRFDFTSFDQYMHYVDLIDIDDDNDLRVTINDVLGNTREIFVPSGWTMDTGMDSALGDGTIGVGRLDLTLGNAQLGEGGLFTTVMTEDGFEAGQIASVEFLFTGTGAIDNFTFGPHVPTPASAALMALGGLAAARRRR